MVLRLGWSSMIQTEDTTKDAIPCTGKSGKLRVNQKFTKRIITFCFSTSWQECCEYYDFCEILVSFEAFSLMGCCAVLMDSSLPMFQQCMVVPSSQVKMSTIHICVRACVCVCTCTVNYVSCDRRGTGNVCSKNRTGNRTIIRLVFL